jgi:hypothetical protein
VRVLSWIIDYVIVANITKKAAAGISCCSFFYAMPFVTLFPALPLAPITEQAFAYEEKRNSSLPPTQYPHQDEAGLLRRKGETPRTASEVEIACCAGRTLMRPLEINTKICSFFFIAEGRI